MPYALRATTTLMLLGLALAACGPVKRVNPPGATVAGLTWSGESALKLKMRVQNFSDVDTTFDRVECTLTIAGRTLTCTPAPLSLEVSPHQGEPVDVAIALSSDDAAALRRDLDAATAKGASINYHLGGRVHASKPAGESELKRDGQLSPVPGKPGEFR